jgi:TolA-binding protein
MMQLKFSKKHKIKEDEFVERVFAAKQWAVDHARPLSTAGAVAAGVLLIAFLLYRSGQSREQRALSAFGNAMIAYQSRDTINAVSNFRVVEERFSNMPQAAMSCLVLAGIYYGQRDYAQAQAYYEKLLSRHASHADLKGAALKGLAYCAIQQKQYDQAVQRLNRFVGECPSHYSMPEVLLSLGECRVALKDTSAARESFQAVLDRFPQSPQSIAARDWMATL